MSTDEYVPSDEDMEDRYVFWSPSLMDFPPGGREAWAEKLRAELRRGLTRVREEQRESDLAMHYAYRPEVVAEIAVCLDDDVDWDRIATWCGARIETTQDPSGEYTSVLVLGNRDVAARGMWIVKRLDGTYSVRAEVAEPDASTLARVRREAKEEAAREIRDALVASLDLPTGPVQTGAMNATAGWASWITDRFNLPTPEETDR